ncbi:LuxR C-terminal-related transcriptional regulator [Rahnella sp. EDr1-12]|uniref:helix-turn-helix domain-containing protein n=1 Tax=unclassified Rahnella TaxID=2635087 RepID=UPI003BAB1A97
MPRVFKVLIIDSDNFFAAGLKLSIENYFAEVKMPVFIRETKHSYRMADLIFWAPHCPGAALPARIVGDRTYMSKLVIVMTQHREELTQYHVPFFLYRHQKPGVVYEIIDHALTEKFKSEIRVPENLLTNKLTERQRQILHYLSKGMQPGEIANLLNIDCKTVSTHKRSAMGKLKLTKNTDLYKWLIKDTNTKSE